MIEPRHVVKERDGNCPHCGGAVWTVTEVLETGDRVCLSESCDGNGCEYSYKFSPPDYNEPD